MGNLLKKIIGSKNLEPEMEEDLNEEYEDALEENDYEEEEIEEYEEEENEEEDETDDEDEEDETDDEDDSEKWMQEDFEEGQLSIDVYQDSKYIYVKSTIAGVKPEDIDISINNDMLTIRGKREETEEIKEKDFLYKECYWGSFSRSIILPTEVQANKIEALLENGVLTIQIPKAKPNKPISVKVKKQ